MLPCCGHYLVQAFCNILSGFLTSLQAHVAVSAIREFSVYPPEVANIKSIAEIQTHITLLDDTSKE